MNTLVDDRLNQGLEEIVSQFPPLVRDCVDLDKQEAARQWRLKIFEAFSMLQPRELTVDQITAAQLPELLALAVNTNPPFFQPTAITPAILASQKASAYVSAYLVSQFTRRLSMVGNPPQLVEELTTNAGDVMLAQVQRLRFNYNQRYRLADYLADAKNRTGLLAAMTAKQSAALTGASGEMVSLAGQIGQALGTAFYISAEQQRLARDQEQFNHMITAGHYPAALLFAQQEHPQWFADFFNHQHRPAPALFAQAYQLTLAHSADVDAIINDLVNQLQLDIKVLPSGPAQSRLSQLITVFTSGQQSMG